MEKLTKGELKDKPARIPLSDDELETVTGGWSQNADGTYNIYAGDVFQREYYIFTVEETILNATLDTRIKCEYGHLINGQLADWGKKQCSASYLLGLS